MRYAGPEASEHTPTPTVGLRSFVASMDYLVASAITVVANRWILLLIILDSFKLTVRLDSFKPTIRLDSAQLEHVHELFLPGTREWDEQLVWSSFIYRDALEILKLRPGFRLQKGC